MARRPRPCRPVALPVVANSLVLVLVLVLAGCTAPTAAVDESWCREVESAWMDYRHARAVDGDASAARDALYDRWSRTAEDDGADQATTDVLRLIVENMRTAWLGPGRADQNAAAIAVVNGLAVLADSCAARGHDVDLDTDDVPLDRDGTVRSSAQTEPRSPGSDAH
jgi:hypothetical protein